MNRETVRLLRAAAIAVATLLGCDRNSSNEPRSAHVWEVMTDSALHHTSIETESSGATQCSEEQFRRVLKSLTPLHSSELITKDRDYSIILRYQAGMDPAELYVATDESLPVFWCRGDKFRYRGGTQDAFRKAVDAVVATQSAVK